jgi:hypothetical protein
MTAERMQDNLQAKPVADSNGRIRKNFVILGALCLASIGLTTLTNHWAGLALWQDSPPLGWLADAAIPSTFLSLLI